jgi:hypothetical protein
VKESIRSLFESADKGLIRLLRRRQPNLTPREIIKSIRRLDIRIESLTGPAQAIIKQKAEHGVVERKKRQLQAGQKAAMTRKLQGGVTLVDLIAARLLVAPLRLFRKYKGHPIEAKLLPDGSIEFQGSRFDSCSSAAEMARSTVVGKRLNTNGWVFWQYQDEQGQKCTLDQARKRFLKT